MYPSFIHRLTVCDTVPKMEYILNWNPHHSHHSLDPPIYQTPHHSIHFLCCPFRNCPLDESLMESGGNSLPSLYSSLSKGHTLIFLSPFSPLPPLQRGTREHSCSPSFPSSITPSSSIDRLLLSLSITHSLIVSRHTARQALFHTYIEWAGGHWSFAQQHPSWREEVFLALFKLLPPPLLLSSFLSSVLWCFGRSFRPRDSPSVSRAFWTTVESGKGHPPTHFQTSKNTSCGIQQISTMIPEVSLLGHDGCHSFALSLHSSIPETSILHYPLSICEIKD